MSQERAEQFAFDPEKVRQLLVDLVKDSLIHGLPISSQKYVLYDLAEAHEEIERMDIVIAEQADYINAINKASDGLDTAVYLHMCHIEKQNFEMLHLEALEWNAYEKEFAMKFVVQDRDIEIWERDETIRTLTAKVQDRDKEIAEADAWTEYWRREAFRNHPTQEAYDAACAALEKHRERADAGDKESERLRAALVEAQVNVQHIRRIADFASYTEKYAMVALGVIDRALKRAE